MSLKELLYHVSVILYLVLMTIVIVNYVTVEFGGG